MTRPLPNGRYLFSFLHLPAILLAALLITGLAWPEPAHADTIRLAAASSTEPATGVPSALGDAIGQNLPPIQTKQDVAERKEAAIQDMLMRRAEELLVDGDVSGARMILEHLLRRAGEPEVYWALARTYDPIVLKTLQVVGTLADISKAQELYERARRSADMLEEPNPAPRCKRQTCLLRDNEPGERWLALR